MTTEGLRHIQFCENAIRENINKKRVMVHHIQGDINPADIFTKEDKGTLYFRKLCNLLLSDPNLLQYKCRRISKTRVHAHRTDSIENVPST
mgnify:CR=1 FL=1